MLSNHNDWNNTNLRKTVTYSFSPSPNLQRLRCRFPRKIQIFYIMLQQPMDRQYWCMGHIWDVQEYLEELPTFIQRGSLVVPGP